MRVPFPLRHALRAAALAAVAVCLSRPAAAQVIDTRFPIPDGPVNAMVRSGNTLYVGGQFNFWGYDSGPGVYSATTGNPVGSPKINGPVTAVAEDGAGGWYVGGYFTQVGGLSRLGLAHILSDFTVSPWNPNAGGGFTSERTVRCFARSGSTLYLGGTFLSVGGTSRAYLAAVDAGTGALLPWNPVCVGTVNALALDGGSVIAGGEFLTIGGFSRMRLARIDAATGVATSWNPGASGVVRSLLLNGATLYVGGDFSTCGSAPRQGLAALDAATGLATAWTPPITFGSIHALSLRAGLVYLGGSFGFGGPTLSIAAIDTATAAPSGWSAGATGQVKSMAFGAGVVYVAGDFITLGSNERLRVGAIDLTTGQVTPFEVNANSGDAGPLVLNSAGLFIGGTFSRVGWVRHTLAAMNLDSGKPTAWNPNLYPLVGGPVTAMASDGTRLIVGGSFVNAGQQYRNRLAALDLVTGLATAWDPNVDETVQALEIDGSTLYVGGSFAHVGATARDNLASIDLVTGLLTSWNPSAGGAVRAIATGPSEIYVGGDFVSAGGQVRNYLASFDRSTSNLTPWNPGPNQPVYDLEVGPAAVYASGYFTMVGGQARVHVAAFDPPSGLLTGFVPAIISEPGHVSAVKLDAGSLYVAGSFRTSGFRYHLAALNATTGTVLPWELDVATTTVLSFVTRDLSLYLGGSYTSIDSQLLLRYFAATQRYPLPVNVEPSLAPAGASLECWPSPASRATTIAFRLPAAQRVELACYDLLGRRVATLARGERLMAGPHERALDVSRLAPGVYVLRLTADGIDRVRRVVVSR